MCFGIGMSAFYLQKKTDKKKCHVIKFVTPHFLDVSYQRGRTVALTNTCLLYLPFHKGYALNKVATCCVACIKSYFHYYFLE